MSLPLLQLLDSACPTGAFSHSFGMETAIQEGSIVNSDGLLEWLTVYLQQGLAMTDGIALSLAYSYADAILENTTIWQNIAALDRRLYISKLARESRDGSVKIGKRYLDLVLQLYPEIPLQHYREQIRQHICTGNSCIVHAFVCVFLKETLESTISSYFYTSVNSLVQNAIRSMSLGQTEGQKVLRRMLPVIADTANGIAWKKPSIDGWHSNHIFQEIASMRHEHLYSRLFMS
ncbi:urease accessory protein UreF [Fodinisporobacter ferrooxydans]|uniref:Urease accessory protein UreF n=1 Tax=Fodinisporobacter ferrooxydans TaxID=2901836 RepID=A0ABY4CFQ7_9BACL|nr:urease accessory protein UreF [Alicyclobacillaceae bacterium MYW30-H2]